MRVKLLKLVMLCLALVILSPLVHASGTVDTATVDLIDGTKLTVLAIFGLITLIVTGGLGLRLYKKAGKRAIGAM